MLVGRKGRVCSGEKRWLEVGVSWGRWSCLGGVIHSVYQSVVLVLQHEAGWKA